MKYLQTVLISSIFLLSSCSGSSSTDDTSGTSVTSVEEETTVEIDSQETPETSTPTDTAIVITDEDLSIVEDQEPEYEETIKTFLDSKEVELDGETVTIGLLQGDTTVLVIVAAGIHPEAFDLKVTVDGEEIAGSVIEDSSNFSFDNFSGNATLSFIRDGEVIQTATLDTNK